MIDICIYMYVYLLKFFIVQFTIIQAVTLECPCKKRFRRHFPREMLKNSRCRQKTI